MIGPMNFQKSLLAFFALLVANLACTTAPKDYTLPDSGQEPTSGLETLVIVGTNDIHGTLSPLSLKSREEPGVQPVQYEAGGTAVLAGYINILRKEFGDHLIWLDAGDEYQGSIVSNSEKGAPMVQFLNEAGVNAAAVGNHEFDFGLDTLKARMSEARFPYLAANISEKATGLPADFPNTKSRILVRVGNVKVGVIGLSTLDTPRTTLPQNVATLQFDDLKTAALREAQALRKEGAQVVLLTAHSGLKCDHGKLGHAHAMRKQTDPQGHCGENDEMVQLLQSLPSGTIDAVISGHTHQIVHHWIAGVPVIQGGAFGRYLNVIYLTFDWSKKKLISEKSRIEGPIPVCTRVFKNQNDCNGDRPAPKKGRGPLVPPVFHGVEVYPDARIQEIQEPIIKKSEAIKNRVLGRAVRPLDHSPHHESELGNLTADAIKQAAHSDVAIMNFGGLRSPLEAGPVTFGAVFQSLPFENRVSKVKVTGKELKLILRVAESGSRGLTSVSGLQLRLLDPKSPASYTDLNHNRKGEAWEVDRLLHVSLANGEPIEDDKFYNLGMLDFLVTGGDDFEWVMSQIPPDRIQVDVGIRARDALVQYIEQQKILNPPDHPLINPLQPRLIFEKPKPAKHSKQGAKKIKKRRRRRKS
jgi:5'-nucleotidase